MKNKLFLLKILVFFCLILATKQSSSGNFSLMKTLGRYPSVFKQRVKDSRYSPLEIFNINHKKIYPLLSQLSKTPFFRYYSVDVDSSCPFWTVQFHCLKKNQNLGGCSLEEPQKIPACHVKNEGRIETENLEKDLANLVDDFGNENSPKENEKENNSNLNKKEKEIEELKNLIANNGNHWFPQNNEKSMLVDLLINPEGNTGYTGPEPKKVWDSILIENSFKNESKNSENEKKLKDLFDSFVRAQYISTTSKIAAYFFLDDSGVDAKLTADKTKKMELFSPNLEMFQKSLQNKSNFNELLGNLIKLWVSTAKAIQKLTKNNEKLFNSFPNCEIDSNLIKNLNQQISVNLENKFDENLDFNLENDFKMKLFNISRVLDCVGCEKCKMWSKLQVHSLAVTLKILFSKNSQNLEKNEIIALFDGFIAHSLALKNIFDFFEMQERAKVSRIFSIFCSGLILFVVLFFLMEVLFFKNSRKNSEISKNKKKKD